MTPCCDRGSNSATQYIEGWRRWRQGQVPISTGFEKKKKQAWDEQRETLLHLEWPHDLGAVTEAWGRVGVQKPAWQAEGLGFFSVLQIRKPRCDLTLDTRSGLTRAWGHRGLDIKVPRKSLGSRRRW